MLSGGKHKIPLSTSEYDTDDETGEDENNELTANKINWEVHFIDEEQSVILKGEQFGGRPRILTSCRNLSLPNDPTR